MMERLDESTIQKLRAEYFDLVKQSIKIQKKGDIKAFANNAILAERVAEQLQKLSAKR